MTSSVLMYSTSSTVEPRLAKSFRYTEVPLYQGSFHMFNNYWGYENRLLYRGFRYVEVRYIKVPLY